MDTEWFKTRKREMKVTDADVAAALGVERSVANKVLNGRVAFNAKRAPQMSELFKVTREEILFRAGISDVEPSSIQHPKLLSSSDIIVWGRVAAGIWMEESFAEPDPDNMTTIEYDRLPGDHSTEHLFAVEPVGDSMNLAFLPNTLLICRRVPFGIGEVEEGQYVIIAREQHGLHEMTCKRIGIDDDGNFLLISESSNPKFSDPIKVPRSDEHSYCDGEISIVGVVVREVRDHSRRLRH